MICIPIVSLCDKGKKGSASQSTDWLRINLSVHKLIEAAIWGVLFFHIWIIDFFWYRSACSVCFLMQSLEWVQYVPYFYLLLTRHISTSEFFLIQCASCFIPGGYVWCFLSKLKGELVACQCPESTGEQQSSKMLLIFMDTAITSTMCIMPFHCSDHYWLFHIRTTGEYPCLIFQRINKIVTTAVDIRLFPFYIGYDRCY